MECMMTKTEPEHPTLREMADAYGLLRQAGDAVVDGQARTALLLLAQVRRQVDRVAEFLKDEAGMVR